MHTIDLSKYSIRTDLIIENSNTKEYKTTKEKINNILV